MCILWLKFNILPTALSVSHHIFTMLEYVRESLSHFLCDLVLMIPIKSIIIIIIIIIRTFVPSKCVLSLVSLGAVTALKI